MAMTGFDFRNNEAGRDIIITGVTIGVPVEEIVAELERRGLLAGAELAGLQRRTIIMLAQRLKPAERLDFEQAVTELERAVEIALDVIARGERGTNDDTFVNRVLARVAERVRSYDLDGAAGAIDAALAETRRSQKALLEEGVKVDTLRRDSASVARRIEMLVAVDHPTDRPAWLPEFRDRLDALQADGETSGINFSLSVASELASRMASSARDDGERGIAAFLLGNTLAILGERESGTMRLEEAVAAYRQAIPAVSKRSWLPWPRRATPHQMQLEPAGVQNNLGIALLKLGDRERGTARLEEAVTAFRAALTGILRDRAPLQWAIVQNNLGNALSSLGEREQGAARLEEAVAAYRAALEERTRERVPLDWATTLNNLGTTLIQLGERESDTTRLEEAVIACRGSLKEWTRERVPLRWAEGKNNLGTALKCLGELEHDELRLKEAIAVYHEALEVMQRERTPFAWAMTQNNLGAALKCLGESEGSVARLREAVTAFRAALQEWTRERVPMQWAGTQNNVGAALASLGWYEGGTAQLEEAVAAYRSALTEWTRERVPMQWAGTQNNLGGALASLGARESGTARLEEAVVAYDAALEIFLAGESSHHVAMAMHNRMRASGLFEHRRKHAS